MPERINLFDTVNAVRVAMADLNRPMTAAEWNVAMSAFLMDHALHGTQMKWTVSRAEKNNPFSNKVYSCEIQC